MTADDYRQAWQAPSAHPRVAVDAAALLDQLRRQDRQFRAAIVRRDVREVAVALVLLPVWYVLGVAASAPWTWYLAMPALVWVAAFLLVDRRRQRRRAAAPGAPLVASIDESLAQVDHQIWLLRNVVWWYLLPLALPIVIHLAYVSWLKATSWRDALFDVNPLVLVVILATFAFVGRLNQRAVRAHLEPRRQELRTLRASLAEDPPAATASEPDPAGPR